MLTFAINSSAIRIYTGIYNQIRGENMLEFLNKYLCGILLPIAIIVVGIYFAFRLKLFYILHPIKLFKSMCKGGFKSLSLALAGTLGVGNIVGVASAIISGGAGAIFWMWISAFIAMSLKYAEVYLAMKYREKSVNNEYYGGAPYYIYGGLKNKTNLAKLLSIAFAFLCVINSLTTGNLVQINAVSDITALPKICIGLLFVAIIIFVIIGGIKRISTFTSVLMPILSVFYVALCVYIIFINIREIPSVFALIFKEAFSLKCVASGFCGYGIASAIRFGVSRGLLSNEAGCGTSPTAHASSSTSDIHSQGCLGIFEVFVDTILLCTLTALVILLYGKNTENPMGLVSNAFSFFTYSVGKCGIIISSLLFALATIACQYYYGMESLKYITSKKKAKAVYTVIFCLTTLLGAMIPMSLMWQISDLALCVMTLCNLLCLLALRREI